MDKLERLTNLLLVLLEAPRALTMREIVDQVEGYPAGEAACRQTFERDKRTLREGGVPLETVTVEEREGIQGYRVRPERYYLPELGLSDEEQAALTGGGTGWAACRRGTSPPGRRDGPRRRPGRSDRREGRWACPRPWPARSP